MGKTHRRDPGNGRVEWVDGYDPKRDHGSFGRNIPRYARDCAVWPCCFDAPGSESRKKRIRAAKKREKQRALREYAE